MDPQEAVVATAEPLAVELLGLPRPGPALAVGDLLSASARAFSAHPLLMLFVATASYVPGGVLFVLYDSYDHGAGSFSGTWAPRLANIFFASIGTAILVRLIAQSTKGRSDPLGVLLKSGIRDAFWVFAVDWLSGFALLASAIPGAILVGAGVVVKGPIGVLLDLLGALVLLGLLSFMGLGVSLAVPLVVLRGGRAGPSLGKSWAMMKGQRLPLGLATLALLAMLSVFACMAIVPFVALTIGGGSSTGPGSLSFPSVVLLGGWMVLCQAVWRVSFSLLTTVACQSLSPPRSTVDVHSIAHVFS